MRCRSGFTLIELLTLIALITVISAILLPAIVQSQDEARGNACKNNLKQLGLAMHNYHDVFRTFSPGWCARNADADDGPFFGWQTAILPFVDQAPLYNQIDTRDFAGTERKHLETPLEVYRCPSDAMVDLNPLRDKFATSSYSGNAGNERLPGSADTPEKLNGIFWRNSRVGLKDIIDGTSNTILAGERSITSASGIWVGVTANRNENDAITDCSHHSRLNRGMTSFSSGHPGIVFFVFCDGAVRPISQDVESSANTDKLGLFQKLAQRNDGQVVGEF